MPLTSMKTVNVHLEDENPTSRGKKQVSDTPRRALGDMKNMATPNRNFLKGSVTIQKQKVIASNFGNVDAKVRQPEKSHTTPLADLHFDIDDDTIEECNLKEDRSVEETLFQRQNTVILSDPENEAEYFEKLISTECYGLSSISEDDEPIETCGCEDDAFDWSHVMNNADGNAVLVDDFPPFPYERPDETGLDKVKNYTLQEMEDLFDSFPNVLIF